MRKRKSTAIINFPLPAVILLYAVFSLLLTTCYLEGDINALKPFHPGLGTEQHPYKVYDEETLRKVGTGDGWGLEAGIYYEQINDIILSGDEWTPIGNGNYFNANFNGQGFTISNLTINNSGADAGAQGLFGTIGSDGEIENVNLIDIKIAGNEYTGSVAGITFGTVTNCCSTGDSKVTGNKNVGGIVGSNYGSVSKCYSTCTVEGVDSVGGIAGINDGISGNGIVKNCYSTGDITGDSFYTGGVVGFNVASSGNAIITHCYSTGFVNIGNYVGGVAGYNYASCIVEKCVALGPEVRNGSGSIGRVIGANNSGTSQGNYARGNMQVDGDPKNEGSINDALDGVNVDEHSHDGGDTNGGYYDKVFWTGATGWENFDEHWEMPEGDKLPILKGFPRVAQTPEILEIVP